MEKSNFTIHVGQKEFMEDAMTITQNLKNDFGEWYVVAKRCGYSIIGVINFKPKKKIFNHIKVNFKIEFENSRASDYNVNTIATRIENQHSYYFGTFCSGITNNYNTYEIKIHVEVSELDGQPCLIPSTIDHLKEMFKSGKLADTIIKTKDDKHIKAHNFILSRSEVFDAMLNKHDTKEGQEGEVNIEDVDYDVLVEMIRFMYTDEIPKIKEMALDLLLAADKYNLSGLADECGKYLIRNVAVESFAEVLIVADSLGISELKNAAIDFVIDNRKQIFSSDGWKRLKKVNMEIAMEVMEKFVSNA